MKANKYLLNRKTDKEEDKIYNKMGRFLDEIANFGSHLLDFCQEKKKFEENDAPIIATYTQILSMVDGISILMKKGTADAIKPILRSVLELKLKLEYMLQEEPKKGILAYQVEHVYGEIQKALRQDENTEEGKRFRKIFQGQAPPSVDSTDRIKQLESKLNEPTFREVNEEWCRTKRPNWTKLFNGPGNVYELAKYLAQEYYYELVYRDMSSFMHGGITMSRFKKAEEGHAINPSVRVVETLPLLLVLTTNFSLDVYLSMLKKYNTDKIDDFNKWMKDNITEEYEELSKINFTVSYETR